MITSKENDLIKHIKSLQKSKYRKQYKEYFVEGIKLVREAISEHMDIVKIVVCEELLRDEIEFSNYDVEYVSLNLFEYISDTASPQGVMAILKMKKARENISDIVIALDDVQDPGNVGTIIRTLDSAGLKSILLSKNCADVYNPKVVRSTMGAIYRADIIECENLYEEISNLKAKGYKVIATSLETNKFYYDMSFDEKSIIVIGNESNGVSESIQNISDYKIKIPMLGKTESLNASVASSIIMYEYVRRKLNG